MAAVTSSRWILLETPVLHLLLLLPFFCFFFCDTLQVLISGACSPEFHNITADHGVREHTDLMTAVNRSDNLH